MEAYDLLPHDIRLTLMEGPQEWCTVHILNKYRKLIKKGFADKSAQRKMIKMIWDWHKEEIDEGYVWRDRKPGQRWSSVPQSPHNQAEATMATAYSKAPA